MCIVAVVNIAHSFGVEVVAEGVETPLQAASLNDAVATCCRATCSAGLNQPT
ncbi:MAG: hypothetical protein M0Z42_08300 [Actinomycetota bacterium]|nr:hypothetical protein [Actinomycetota bacterium]